MELLKSGEVHLKYAFAEEFRASLKYAKAIDLLSDEERKQHQRYAFENDKDLYLLARYVLRTSLSKYYDKILPEHWEFKFNTYGRPSIANQNAPKNLHFNLSHAEGMVVCGFAATEEIGVDVESASRVCSYLELAERCFSEMEFEKLKSFGPKQVPSEFFNFWTLKEAYIKARGMGLHLPLDQFSFVIVDHDDIKIIFDSRMKEVAKRWQFKLLNPRGSFRVAVALAHEGVLLIDEEFY